MEKKIKDLTVDEFTSLVKRIIKKELTEFDPDKGLEVREEIRKLLNRSARDRRSGVQKTVGIDEAFH
jgi:hypothetical protein